MNNDLTQQVLAQLEAVIQDRKNNPPERSYTTTLFAGGVPRIGEKVLEEAAEVVEAAGEADPDGDHLVREAADLVYHLMVLLVYKNTEWTNIETELARRFGICGLDEKAARSTTPVEEVDREEDN